MQSKSSPRDILDQCRRDRDSEAGVAFRRLLKAARADCLDELALAEGVRVHRLQGAILTITGLLRDIAATPREPEQRDGAYI